MCSQTFGAGPLQTCLCLSLRRYSQPVEKPLSHGSSGLLQWWCWTGSPVNVIIGGNNKIVELWWRYVLCCVSFLVYSMPNWSRQMATHTESGFCKNIFHSTVAKLIVRTVGFLCNMWSLNLTMCLKIFCVVIWRFTNKIELDFIWDRERA